MSLLPALFRRGERLQPLGTARPRNQSAPSSTATPDWTRATASDKPPKKVRLRLTDWAEGQAADFLRLYDTGNCSCHIIPPCGSCTHPGNPHNLDADDEAWVMGYEQEGGAQ